MTRQERLRLDEPGVFVLLSVMIAIYMGFASCR